jgi:predicted  nucleic acid-binding Zn-ribbon protein
MKKEKLKELIEENDSISTLSTKEKEQMEQDVREITGIADEETPVFLDFESVMLVKPGKYLIDLHKLFAKDKPRVYKLEDGKYIIDLSMKNFTKEKK